jgi:uncharacterized protein
MICEGIVTTVGEDGAVNMAPMGPIVDASMSLLVMRPFRTSRTYANLKRSGQGVFHVTDDVELLARAAVNEFVELPEMRPAESVEGYILSDACRWYAFQVRSLEDRQQRTRIECQVVDWQRQRDFFGFNRAKHAVLEAAILATRLHLIDAGEILRQFQTFTTIVQKTAGPQELRAFRFLDDYVRQQLQAETPHGG